MGQSPPGKTQSSKQLAILSDSRISECSGIVCSQVNANCFWLHNDSGDGPFLFLVNSNGQTVGRVQIQGATAIDWEDIALHRIGTESYLIIGDIGGNAQRRDSIDLYFVKEPNIEGKNSKPMEVSIQSLLRLRVSIPGGVTNYEAIAVDPKEKTILIIEKAFLGGRMYTVPIPAINGERAEVENVSAKEVGTLPLPFVTACDISEDGRFLVAISYRVGTLYERSIDATGVAESWRAVLQKEPFTLPLGSLRQSEAVCFMNNGKSIVVSSEFLPTPLVEIELPDSTSLKKNP